MIPATRSQETIDRLAENGSTTEFNIETIVTQEDIDAIDRAELTDEESALLDAVQAELNEVDTDTPPSS